MLSRYRGILVVLGAITILWLGSLIDLFRTPNGWVYDISVRLDNWQDSETPEVLMVETNPLSELSTEEGLQMLDTLRRLGARQLIFLSLPGGSEGRFLAQVSDTDRLLIGHAGSLQKQPSWRSQTPSGGHAHKPSSPPFGDLSLPPAESGVHRYGAASMRKEGSEHPSLAMVAAQNLGLKVQPGNFLVNFNQGANWIPRVTSERVLRGGLIPELVKGRSVLIGPARAPAAPALYTPLNASGRGMSLLEFQAYAVDTLLRDRRINNTPRLVNMLLLGCIGLFSMVVYQWINLDRGSWLTTALILVYLTLGWFLLHGLMLWLPIVEIVLAQLMMFWLFVRLKLLRDDEMMRHTVLRRLAKLQDYMLPPDFYKLDEHWAQVINFIDQTLNLNRVIFLEKVEGDHRVREVKALRCSLDDIDERRRDFERSPYKDAIAEAWPTRLERRLFFNAGDSDIEYDQYLMPLLFAGEVQGFWAFDVDPAELDSSQNLLGNIRSFGLQIAELLYHRHRWQQQRNAETRVFRRLFRLEAVKTSSQEFGELLGMLDNRLHAVQAVFDGLATATIHYDLFGRVVQLNKSMERFLLDQELPGYQLTALDLLVELTDLMPTQARRLLQQVVVDRRDFKIPVILRDSSQRNFFVHLKPLSASEPRQDQAEPTSPFELAGILFELNDTSDLGRDRDTKKQLLDWLRLYVRNELIEQPDRLVQKQPMLAVEAKAGDQPIALPKAIGDNCLADTQPLSGVAHARQPAKPLQERVTNVLSTLEMVERMLSTDWEHKASAAHPLDLSPLLCAAVENYEFSAMEKRVWLINQAPPLMSLVMAQPEEFNLLLFSLLEVMLADATADSALQVDACERDGYLTLNIKNSGFGIPNEQLQALIWQEAFEVSDEFKALRMAVRPVKDWGGEIQIHSEVGVGIRATIRLQVAS